MADIIKMDEYKKELRMRMHMEWVQNPLNHEFVSIPHRVTPEVTFSKEELERIGEFLVLDEHMVELE